MHACPLSQGHIGNIGLHGLGLGAARGSTSVAAPVVEGGGACCCCCCWLDAALVVELRSVRQLPKGQMRQELSTAAAACQAGKQGAKVASVSC